ncbi:hypothetical protein KDK95_24685 [Actinospica sp. MGRD01-02]|uniref:Uncharacterized protein n=1 Tax=Actinospica acidithermotolerans TaxID=2828514 RepID=A0A941EFC3_9ACTN|nr:hypothetical protein [Actinospica acidithermotolerans]MBR7829525.1 hypothetical protein [Actinospica acidithermotolerans]
MDLRPAVPIVPRGYHRPGRLDEYLPSADEPIDRWFQAANASNVRTTMAIIADLCPRPPAYLVDPFAGSGSAAVVSRLLDVPFHGIELDPVLACVTIAKALARSEHVPDGFAPAGGGGSRDGRDTLVADCLALLEEIPGSSAGPAVVRRDLRANEPPAHAATTVVHGDASSAASWSHIAPRPGPGVLYTSPPFGPSSPRVQVEDAVRERARALLEKHDVSREPGAGRPAADGGRRETPPGYADLVVAVLRQARRLGPLTAVIEHEPPDDGRDDRAEIAARIVADTDAELTAVLETQAFSRRGPLSLFVCELSA